MKKLVISMLGIVMVGGCATAPSSDMESAERRNQTVTCSVGGDCNEKWRRAEQWVRMHSYWPIDILTDEVIETERPRFRNFSQPRYRIVRKQSPESAGQAYISMEASCLPSVHCAVDTNVVRDDFMRFVQTGKSKDES